MVAVSRWIAQWLAFWASLTHGAGKKPLFEYDDHYVMLNDKGRNNFYRRALARVTPACGPGCIVLDVGAGSGLLSILAASFGASHVLAVEANPELAALAERTIARNRPVAFPESNVSVVAELSSRVGLERMPRGQQADILVTETFGTMLLGEGAMNFVPDARDRLLKEGGVIIPAGGCQYVTLVEAPDFASVLHPIEQGGLNLSRLEVLQDNLYWKATVGASNSPLILLSERICVLELDLYKDTREVVPENRTFRLQATRSGTLHAALLDWDVWADANRTELLSTAEARGFAGDVAWGRLLQLQEEADEDWQYASFPKRLVVEAGDWLDLGIEFIAGGISLHARVRRASKPQPAAPAVGELQRTGPPPRMRGVDRGELVEASEFILPVAADAERLHFYQEALEAALAERSSISSEKPTLLDCSGQASVLALLAAKQHGMHTLALAQRNEFARVVRAIAEDNGLEELVEAYAADPRDVLELLLPLGRRADIIVLEPPGTPLRGLSPFALLPAARKHLLREDAVVLPAGGCFEVTLVESADLAQLFSVPGGHWEGVDLSVWNEEARRRGILERLVPYTKWFGPKSTMRHRWLAMPTCVFDVDFAEYGQTTEPEEKITSHEFEVADDGMAHALVARWTIWSGSRDHGRRLSAESAFPGRALVWPTYVQALAAPGTALGLLEPLSVRRGQRWTLEVLVRQGAGKRTGVAGPEFALRLHGAGVQGVEEL